MVSTFRNRISGSSLPQFRRRSSADTQFPFSSQQICNLSTSFSHQQRLRLSTTRAALRSTSTTRTERRLLSSPSLRSRTTTGRITAPQYPVTNRIPTSILATRLPFSTTSAVNMGSDEDYMAFLNKANEDPAKGVAKSQEGAKSQTRANEFRATEEGVEVPKVLAGACKDAYYVSDADEPFEVVAIGWDEGGRGLPDEEEFAELIQHWDPKNAEIEIQDPVDWDRNGQYKGLVDAVREAGQGNDVRVYRVGKGGVKAEYWLVTTEGKGKGAKLVGVKALAVES